MLNIINDNIFVPLRHSLVKKKCVLTADMLLLHLINTKTRCIFVAADDDPLCPFCEMVSS